MEDIKKGMNKIFNVSIATSVIILVLGIFLFIQPDTIIHMISIVLGGIILVSGIIALIDYFGSKYNPSLISGVITSIIGLILIINTKLVASILPFVLGIYFTINGINRLQYSLELKKEKMNYLSSFIVSILIIVCGVSRIFPAEEKNKESLFKKLIYNGKNKFNYNCYKYYHY